MKVEPTADEIIVKNDLDDEASIEDTYTLSYLSLLLLYWLTVSQHCHLTLSIRIS